MNHILINIKSILSVIMDTNLHVQKCRGESVVYKFITEMFKEFKYCKEIIKKEHFKKELIMSK